MALTVAKVPIPAEVRAATSKVTAVPLARLETETVVAAVVAVPFPAREPGATTVHVLQAPVQ